MTQKIVEEPSFRFKRFVFRDRVHAGELLAYKLRKLVGRGTVVLAVPSGGVPVGCVVAEKLHVPLNVILVKKIPIPGETEAGFGAVTLDGELTLNERLVNSLGLTGEDIDSLASQVRFELQRRFETFGKLKPPLKLRDKTVVLVDDGLASGYTMLASVKSVKKKGPRKIIVAVPTGSSHAVQLISPNVDTIVCLNIRADLFFAVADAYKTWYDLSDDEVIEFLREARK
jgi:predicted phosphoribosyltransferase